jgi:F-type H+-transporting ATPase subunit delta
MYAQNDSLAKKYAVAYLNIYFHEITDEKINNLLNLKSFLHKHRMFYAILSIPKFSLQEKLKFTDLVCKVFNLGKSKILLIHLLIEQKRIYLLSAILKKIVEEYYIKKGIIPLQICVSHEIDNYHKNIIINFAKKLIQKEIRTNFCINKNLINGVRIKSNNLLWEHSIKKHLNFLKNNLYQRTIL